MFTIVTVCTGNICRSPMAHAALRELVHERGLDGRVAVSSAGVSDEEHGNPVDPRARDVLARNGLALPDHAAHRITDEQLRTADLLLVMTERHRAQLLRRLGVSEDPRIRLLRSFDPQATGPDLDIADPWYGDAADFDLAWQQIHAACPHVLDAVARELGES